ncbi:MAG: type IV pilus modification PilV family protein [Chthoniobacterales bacterium]
MTRHFHFSARRGSSLVTTLLVIVILAIIVTAFLQSMTVERQAARSYLNRYVAEIAAESGANEAVNLLLKSDHDFPVNAYEEQTVTYNGASVTAPYLVTLKPNDDGTSTSPETRFLCSSVNPKDSSYWLTPQQASGATPAAEFVDINGRTSEFPKGFIGLAKPKAVTDKPTDTYERRVVPVPWRELLADPNKPKDLDPKSGNYNPVIARFAYWVDDDSAKINVGTAGDVDPKDGDNHLRRAGANDAEVALHEVFSDKPDDAGANVKTFRDKRKLDWFKATTPEFPAATYRLLLDKNEAIANDDIWQKRRPFVSSWAKSDERGGAGVRKINLNDFVKQAPTYTDTTNRKKIAEHVVALGDFINQVLPGWGKRRSNDKNPPGSEDDTKKADRRYCVQIAANIQDYIDEDHQPTVIRQNLDTPQWEEPPIASSPGEGAPAQPPAAFGKEVVPMVTEYMAYMAPESGKLRIDHTFEVFNIFTKPVDLSALGKAKILMASRPEVTAVPPSTTSPDLPGTAGREPLSFDVPTNVKLPAGKYSLFTTLPSSSPNRSQNVATGPPWTPLNWITLSGRESTYAYGSTGLKMDGDQTATSTDADTEIVIANEYGYLDIQPRVAQQGPVSLTATATLKRVGSQPFGNEGTSSGNNSHRHYPLDSGDPRAATDIYPGYADASASVSSIAWRRNTANVGAPTILGGDSNGGTYGVMPENDSSPDDYVPEPLVTSAAGSPSERASGVIRDGEMKTIGELGFIYDPAVPETAMYPNGSTTGGTVKRGGFRTLAIGNRYGETEASGSSTKSKLPQTGWKLVNNKPADIPTDKRLSPLRAYHLLDIFDTKNDLRGKILINSALRDPRNYPLRAAFYNLKTQKTDSDFYDENGKKDYAAPPDSTITEAQKVAVDKIIEALRKQADTNTPPTGAIKEQGPFLALGQIGDLDIFNTGTELLGTEIKPNDKIMNHMDRGREEVLRNTFELFTLKGSVYTIYVIAQAGNSVKTADGSGYEFMPRSTVRLIRTVELERQYPTDKPNGEPDDPLRDFTTSLTTSKLKENNTPLEGQTKVKQLFNERY